MLELETAVRVRDRSGNPGMSPSIGTNEELQRRARAAGNAQIIFTFTLYNSLFDMDDTPKPRSFLNFYTINLLIVVLYNLILWLMIFNYYPTGGASLGPGLMLIAVTVSHLFLLVIYWTVATIIKLARKK